MAFTVKSELQSVQSLTGQISGLIYKDVPPHKQDDEILNKFMEMLTLFNLKESEYSLDQFATLQKLYNEFREEPGTVNANLDHLRKMDIDQVEIVSRINQLCAESKQQGDIMQSFNSMEATIPEWLKKSRSTDWTSTVTQEHTGKGASVSH